LKISFDKYDGSVFVDMGKPSNYFKLSNSKDKFRTFMIDSKQKH